MGETERTPHISLEIDQEIFVDAVQDGDVIDDATVATEVTSFDRVGDAYVLEGAIVFAGFMERGQRAQADDGDNVADFMDALSLSDDALSAEQLHQRVPFVLRVPVKSQSRGIVNVASRISDWRLEVVSAGWVRILGDLTIVGLTGSQGYHFLCGAQEDGDLFFKETVQTIEIEAPPPFDVVRSRDEHETPPTDAAPYAVGPEDDIVAANHSMERSAETDPDNEFTQSDLKRLDRVFAEPETDAPAVAAFEFEDQVPDMTAESREQPANHPERTFQPSQSFFEDGFRASFGQSEASPRAHAETADAVRETPSSDEGEETEQSASDEAVDARSVRSLSIRDSMWSFVDFDGPEQTYTLRYVIVEREASIDDLAEYFGCSKSELMRANHVTPDAVLYPGQSLAVPQRS